MANRNPKESRLKKAMKLCREIRDAQEEGRLFYEDDPDAMEAMGTILGIMRGSITGRHLMVRLSAAVRILEEFKGKPKQRIEHSVDDDYATLLQKSMEREAEQRRLAANQQLSLPETTGQILEMQIIDEEPVDANGSDSLEEPAERRPADKSA